MQHYLSGVGDRLKEFFQGKHAAWWMIVFLVLAFNPLQVFAQGQPGSLCADAQLMAQWWSWIGAGWGAGILLGVFGTNPVGAGLIGASVITLQILGYYGC